MQCHCYGNIQDLATFNALCISVFKDKQVNGRSRERAMDDYQTAKQGSRPTAEYCIWFMKKVNLAGTPETSREVISTFKKSLHVDIKSELLRYYVTAPEATTLLEIMDIAVKLDKREQFADDWIIDYLAKLQSAVGVPGILLAIVNENNRYR